MGRIASIHLKEKAQLDNAKYTILHGIMAPVIALEAMLMLIGGPMSFMVRSRELCSTMRIKRFQVTKVGRLNGKELCAVHFLADPMRIRINLIEIAAVECT